jgi:hypothetical protein
MTESELHLVLEFEDGLTIDVVLDRVKGPMIVEDIKAALPIDGRSAFLRGEMKITMGINRGNLKATKQVTRGDIAYMPLGDSLCLYVEDMQTFSQVNVLGAITSKEKIDLLSKIRRGSKVTIRLKE